MTSLVFIFLLRRENAKRERGERDEVVTGGNEKAGGETTHANGIYGTVEEAKRDKGDAWSGYRYIT